MLTTFTKAVNALALIGVLFLGGCYSAPIVKEDALLPSGETTSGFLLIGAERNWTDTDRKDRPLLQLLYRANAGGSGILTVTFQEEADLVLQRLSAGDYVIYNTFFGFKHMGLPGSRFRIVPGQITYAGDFNITVKYPKIGLLTNRTLRVVDNREAATRKLKQQYPVIAGVYAVRSEVNSISQSD